MKNEKCKMKNEMVGAISRLRTNDSLFLYVIVLLVLSGCGKKDPVGYKLVQNRAGEVVRDTTGSLCYYTPYSKQAGHPFYYLYVGWEEDFKVLSLIHFEGIPLSDSMDSVNFICYAEDSLNQNIVMYKIQNWPNDSIKWSEAQSLINEGDSISSSIWNEDTAIFSIQREDIDTIFNIALVPSDSGPIISLANPTLQIYSSDTTDTIIDTTYISPEASLCCDTSFFPLPDSLSDSIVMQTGCVAYECSLYFNVNLPDTAKVSRADLYIPLQSRYGDPSIIGRYESTSSNDSRFLSDSLRIEVTSIVQKWIDNQDSLPYILLRDRSDGLARTILDTKGIFLDSWWVKTPNRE